MEVGERTGRACLTVFEVTGKHEWRSVIAEGPLEPIADDEWSHAFETLEYDAWYPSAFSEAEPVRDFVTSSAGCSGPTPWAVEWTAERSTDDRPDR